MEGLANQASEAFGEFQKLCDDLESLFRKARKLQKSGKPPSGKTIFCGAVHKELADTLDPLVNNQDNNGHHVLLATPLDGEEPAEFQLRTHAAIARADCSVHLFVGAAAFEPAIVQCSAVLGSAITKVYVWQNRDRPAPDAARFLERISPEVLKSRRLCFPQGGADSYLDANLAFDLAPQASPSLPIPSPNGLTALVQFDAADQTNLQILAKRLKDKNFHVQPPIFGGPQRERQSLNEHLYRQAQKVIVLFGESQNFWAFQTCSEVANALGGQLTPERAALVLAPPPEKPPSKPFFSFSQFRVIQCSDPNWINQFDQWAELPAAASAPRTLCRPKGEGPPSDPIDISHECLLRQWTKLRDWVREEARDAAQFQRLADRADGGAGEPLRGRELDTYWEWWDRTKPTPEGASRYEVPADAGLSTRSRGAGDLVADETAPGPLNPPNALAMAHYRRANQSTS